MRFKCNPDKRQWHRWFAWKPVAVGDTDCRWLEYVERREEEYNVLDYTMPYTSAFKFYDTRYRWQYRTLHKENTHE